MKRLLAVIVAVAIAGFVVVFQAYTSADQSNSGTLDFANPLHIPPLLEPATDADGVKRFDLTLQTGTTELVDGVDSETWGVNGAHLGPTLRASRDDQVAFNVHNTLPEPTTLHWHGVHLPAIADGGPHSIIEPSTTWTPAWTVDQPAATLWYHPHLHGSTETHVYRGVLGMFILDDTTTNPSLPSTYGTDDIPLIIQDPRLDNGALVADDPMIDPIGRVGGDIIVNGTHSPHLTVTTEHVRLRLLNASPARTYRFGFDDKRDMLLVGTDGGLIPQPVAMGRLQLSPGERAEIIVAVTPGENTVLKSYPPDLNVNWWDARFTGANDTFEIIEFRAADQLQPSPPIPERLDIDAQDDFTVPSDPTVRRFELSGIEINGATMDMNHINLAVPVDTVEIWEIHNPTGTPHNFHIHDTRFRVIDINGTTPPPHLTGWKDTIAVNGGTTARLAVRFTDYTDPNVPYMYHCHLLRHEDQGMMGQFVVVEPGDTPGTPPDHDDH